MKKGWSVEHALSSDKWFVPNRVYTSRYIVKHPTLSHRAIAEKALGKPLPEKAEIHHVDNNGRNNENTNLVICKDKAYHKLLHIRTSALKESGNANNRKCKICKEWDSTENLYINGWTIYHRKCHAQAEFNRKRS
jgi:hypothetical protein